MILKNDDGKEYLQLTYHERTKKCQGEEYDPYREENIIIAQPNSQRCPVYSFKLYLSKLSPHLNAFFQRPNKNFQREGQGWYRASVVGINAIGKFLQEISKRAMLSTTYTNHCIRGTTATALKKLGFSIPEIASVTKHRNFQSLEHYLEKPSLEERGRFSESLFQYASNQTPSTSSASDVTETDRNAQTVQLINDQSKITFDPNQVPLTTQIENSNPDRFTNSDIHLVPHVNEGMSNDDASQNIELMEIDQVAFNEQIDQSEMIPLSQNFTPPTTMNQSVPQPSLSLVPTQSLPQPSPSPSVIESACGNVNHLPNRPPDQSSAGLLFRGAQLSNCTIHINVAK